MVDGWKIYKIGDLINLLTDYHSNGAYKKLKANVTLLDKKSYAGMIRSTNFEKKNFNDLKYIDEQAYNFLSKSKVYGGDLLMNKIANAGSVYFMPDLGIPVSLGMNLFLLRFNENLALPYYVYWNLKVNERYVKSFSAGSVTKTITKNAVKNLDILLPPLKEQKAIANILSTLDDKIELNLQMNKTLEKMAMALYKHWFVDFGPFQDGAFVDSELGKIPEGWEVKGILDIAKLLSGGTPKTKIPEYWNGDINWVSAKDIGNGVVYINETEKTITEKGVNNSSTKILPADTVILVARGSVGKYGMIAKPMAMNQSCYGLFTKSEFSQGLVFLMFSRLVEQFQRMAYGSVFDTITTSTFKTTKVVSPPNEVVIKVNELIDPLFLKLKRNTLENQTLTKLRNTLLPKLISGEVRVKDAAKLITQQL